MMLVVIRFGSQLPIPGIEISFFTNWSVKQTTGMFGFFNAMIGGSFSSMSVSALSITSYITSSVIIQLLTIMIPRLGELQKDGEDGRKKIQEYTRYITVGLTLIEPGAMIIGFGRQGLLIDHSAWNVIVAIITITTDNTLFIWIGERITERDAGDGISIVLLFDVLPGVPDDIKTLYYRFIFGQAVTKMISSVVMIALITLTMVIFVIVLNDAERGIPVQYSKEMVDRKMTDGQASNIPLKINITGVMPVIFAPSIVSFPVVVPQLSTVDPDPVGNKILMMLNSSSWCRPEYPIYSIGLVIYIVLSIMFAHFYTSITLNPSEVANNMKEQGGSIPGIRPGKPISDYLNKTLNYIVFIDVCDLIAIAVAPILTSGLLNVSRTPSPGTSLIIIVGVALETIRTVESQMLACYYKGFLNG